MITEQNLMERGMLIHLNIGGYAGRKRLDKDQIKDLPQEIVRGVHDLFDKDFKDMITEINHHADETRSYIKRHSIPFPIEAVYFIDSKRIEEIINYLEQRKSEREELVAKVQAEYDQAVKNFADKYPDFYERAKHKYLSQEAFGARFYMKYQFIKISAPSEKDQFITPEMYKAETAKWKETVEEMKKEVLSTIYEELLVATERMKKQMDKDKPNQRTLNNLAKFLDQIDTVYSDFVDRKDMLAVVKKIKTSVLGIDADMLRDSDALKNKFRNEVASLSKEIKALPNIPLKRALDF